MTITSPVIIYDISRDLALELQRGLKAFNLYGGRLDGVIGKETVEAWKRWKQMNYLGQVDVVAPASLQQFRLDLSSHPTPQDKPIISTVATRNIPGIGSPRRANDRIYEGSNFLWGEATKNWERTPRNVSETTNVIKMARYMDEVRKYLGNRSITVTSWFRPEPFNRQVGGVSNSHHVPGLAVDFIVSGQSAQETQRAIDIWHGSKGGLGYGRNFTHIDIRGHRARFNY